MPKERIACEVRAEADANDDGLDVVIVAIVANQRQDFLCNVAVMNKNFFTAKTNIRIQI